MTASAASIETRPGNDQLECLLRIITWNLITLLPVFKRGVAVPSVWFEVQIETTFTNAGELGNETIRRNSFRIVHVLICRDGTRNPALRISVVANNSLAQDWAKNVQLTNEKQFTACFRY